MPCRCGFCRLRIGGLRIVYSQSREIELSRPMVPPINRRSILLLFLQPNPQGKCLRLH